MTDSFHVTLLGAGNVATCLLKTFARVGIKVDQIYSRTEASAKAAAAIVHCPYTTQLAAVTSSSDLYICSLKDAVLENVLTQIPDFGKAMWVHTSGSLPMSVFAPYTSRYGVFYPLQTFSKQREISFEEIPVCLETAAKEDMIYLKTFAEKCSHRVQEMDSVQRSYLHLAAVFACNFTNSMYAAAGDILEKHGIDFEMLLPLIDETARKVHQCTPDEAQTGPAVRMDHNIIDKHLFLLQDDAVYVDLYKRLSDAIYLRSKDKTK